MATHLIAHDKVFAVSLDSGAIAIDLCKLSLIDGILNNSTVQSKSDNEASDGSIAITCLALSNCSKYFVVSSHKDMSVWNVENWTLIAKKQLRRAAGSVKFSPSGQHIAVADKSGDVYLYSTTNFEQDEGKLILGHVSMILDVLVTTDEKFIITSDRDEKIRVSRYPQGYCIQNYCLGHKEFVMTLDFLSHKTDVLISGGGDGCLKFWNFSTGKKLTDCPCSEGDLSKDEKGDSHRRTITKIVSFNQEENQSFVCVTLNKLNGIILYNVTSESEQIECAFVQLIKLDVELLGVTLNKSNNDFFVLTKNFELQSYKIINNELCKHNNEINDRINDILLKNKTLTSKISDSNKFVQSMYKKSFDNVQIYMKRKEERIDGGVKKMKL